MLSRFKFCGFKLIISIIILISVNSFGAKFQFNEYYTEIENYVNLEECNFQNREIYEVCWDNKNNRASSGWTIIDSALMDETNLKKRPSFYKDKMVNTLLPSQIKDPIHKGHTFATDSDFDFSKDKLKLTYNMLNITPMPEKVNIGSFRKIELRGRLLALQMGEILSITKVIYDEEVSRFGLPIGITPIKFQRIYIGEDLEECYETNNFGTGKESLFEQKVDCETLLIKDEKNGK